MFQSNIAGNFTKAKIFKRGNSVTSEKTTNKNVSYIKERP
jgi:hypothetical protein